MIDPALTPEEWAAEAYRLGDGELVELDHAGPDRVEIKDPGPNGGKMRIWMAPDRHALAALCLHRQPLGFSWADVDLLRGIAGPTPHGSFGLNTVAFSETWATQARSLADRIANLLPPRTP